VRELNALYRERPALHALDSDPAGFAWLVGEDAEHSVFAWQRQGGAGDVVVVASNFTPVPRRVYRVGVPVAGRWRVVLDTDAVEYGGSGHTASANVDFETDAIPLHGHAQSLALDLPPLATIFLVPA
jgi:1,4-alpha-glucan branching enzyme